MTEEKKRWSLLKQHDNKIEQAVGDYEYLRNWKEELTSKALKAAEGNNLQEKFETLGEMLMAGLADTANEAVRKTKALAVVMRDRHGLDDEEIEKWLSGNSSTPRTFSQPTSPMPSMKSRKQMTSSKPDCGD